MNIIIQHIETQWTKKSRGNPAATLRNSIPESFSFNGVPSHKGVQLQKINYSETDNFAEPKISDFKAINDNQLRALGLELEESDGKALVRLWGTPWRGSPGISSKVGVIPDGKWLRVITNERTSWEHTWVYYKHVFNIFYDSANKLIDGVVHQEPIIIHNAESDLW